MKFTLNKFLLITLIGLTVVCSCKRNPITGRKQLTVVSEKDVQSMAVTEYHHFLTANQVVPVNNTDAEMVRRVGTWIAAAIKQYYQGQGLAGALEGYNWEFNLVQSKEVNAWCMPGGKVVVYTGLLPLTQNETALAIVLGHEITPPMLTA